MAGIMDQATCGEVHNANLRSVFPTGNRTRPGKNLPLFLNSRILLKKHTSLSWFRGHAKSEKITLSPWNCERGCVHIYLPSGGTGA